MGNFVCMLGTSKLNTFKYISASRQLPGLFCFTLLFEGLVTQVPYHYVTVLIHTVFNSGCFQF